MGAARLGAKTLCVTTMTDGTLLALDARSRTEAEAFWNGAYETDYQRVLIGLVDQCGDVIYDVGANVGLVAVPLARHVRETGRVICFEPVHENSERLRHNIALNDLGNCQVLEVALGERTGQAQIAREARHGEVTGNAILVSDAASPVGYSAVSTIAIEPLDALVEKLGLPLPCVVKLDVEGAEVGFLAGARATLAKSRPMILGEFNSVLMPNFGATFLDAAALLPEDYAIFSFVDARTVREREPAVGLGDVLLVPRELVSKLPLAVA
jgi:FkbM family methyltransferase